MSNLSGNLQCRGPCHANVEDVGWLMKLWPLVSSSSFSDICDISLKRQPLAFAITWNPALVPVYVKTTLNDTNVMMTIYIAERLYPASHQCSGGQLLQGVLVTIRLYMIVTMFWGKIFQNMKSNEIILSPAFTFWKEHSGQYEETLWEVSKYFSAGAILGLKVAVLLLDGL